MSSEGACKVEVLDASGELIHVDDDAELRVDGDALLLHYWDEVGVVVFEGRREADTQSYQLWCRSRPRKATLSRGDSAGLYTGQWSEGDEEGALRVVLPSGTRTRE